MSEEKKKIEIISPNDRNILKFESVKDYLGKKVVSKSGETIGSVADVLFTDNGIKGIVVSKRFSKFYVDSSHFNAVSNKAMLSIDPVILLIGKEVFDVDGKRLGKVSKVIRKNNINDFEAIVVKKKIYSKGIEIPKSNIDVLKKNIILNQSYE